MKTYKNIYHKIYSWQNIVLAFKKARKGKTKKKYVLEFQKECLNNLQQLRFELMSETYKPKPLKSFVIRDPKTRIISKSHFRDRVIHHALVNILQPIFEPSFIYDSCANQIGKGNLFAIERFDKFKREVTSNLSEEAPYLKADIKHYFKEVNHKILLKIIKKRITDEKVLNLIRLILNNPPPQTRGMPLGNLTSQFFANTYLNELDYFIKHKLRAKFYIRYVDDFIILNKSKAQLEKWRKQISNFLSKELKLELHPQKTKISSLSKGIDFVGFRNYYSRRLLRKRNFRKIKKQIKLFFQNKTSTKKFEDILNGFVAYSKHQIIP
jgi:RNA-directed DNA polymerase